jgi:RNA polymerase sigma-70 factor (ECF subfamily)
VNAAAFGKFHKTHRNRLICAMLNGARNREEAEDITASALATAFERRKDFRGESTFYSWVYTIALRELIARSRSKRMESLDDLEGAEPESLVERDLLEQKLDRSECCRRVRTALRRVPTKYRLALVDHFVRGQSVRDVAHRRRIPMGTVLSRLFKGKQILRQAWAESAPAYRPY